jgi:hypothetical protein
MINSFKNDPKIHKNTIASANNKVIVIIIIQIASQILSLEYLTK